MKRMTEQTALTALVNFVCVGKLGKCLLSFSPKDRDQFFTIAENRGWIVPNETKITVTPSGREIALKNLNLCQY